jgi:hypothetical protein
MRESKEYTHVTVSVLTDDGLMPLTATTEKVNTFYSIKNLTSRCNMIDLLTVMANVCKSSKDIATFNKLLDLANGDNALEFDSVTSLAAQLEIPRPTLSLMLSALVREQFLYKETTKKYSINPFMFTGKRVRSNEQRENLQSQWKNKQRE